MRMRLVQQVHSKVPGNEGHSAWSKIVSLPAIPHAGEHIVMDETRRKFTITVLEVFHHLRDDPSWGYISVALVPVTVADSAVFAAMGEDFRLAGWTRHQGLWSEM